ncbi:MAG: hypothetical protein F6K19_44685 [Cyanothece sp. SIO1E1]|nr:hypothetical protein [Cyanothece sp. SIO1E1]
MTKRRRIRFTHAATDPQKCEDMEKRNPWKFRGFTRTEDPILKVDCEFEGYEDESEFPTYLKDD